MTSSLLYDIVIALLTSGFGYIQNMSDKIIYGVHFFYVGIMIIVVLKISNEDLNVFLFQWCFHLLKKQIIGGPTAEFGTYNAILNAVVCTTATMVHVKMGALLRILTAMIKVDSCETLILLKRCDCGYCWVKGGNES